MDKIGLVRENQMDTLAFYIYPVPHGTRFSRDDLSREGQVIILFDYCQILEAVISKQGWNFLIDFYGYEQLFYMNRKSDWLDCSTVEEFIFEVESEKANAPDQL